MLEVALSTTRESLDGAILQKLEDGLFTLRLVRDDLENCQLEFLLKPNGKEAITKKLGDGITATLRGVILRGVVALSEEDFAAIAPGEACEYEFRLCKPGKKPETLASGKFSRKEEEKTKKRESGNAKGSPIE